MNHVGKELKKGREGIDFNAVKEGDKIMHKI
jgi:hypothetical protein